MAFFIEEILEKIIEQAVVQPVARTKIVLINYPSHREMWNAVAGP